MLRLMIVDDEQIIREALSELIDYESYGYELIGTAKNGMEAYDIICDEYPDVVITDIRMPILNGLDLIERSIKSDSRITFILLSGYSEFEYAKQAMKYGVRYYLLKPTDKQELISALTTIRQELEQRNIRILEEEHKLLRELRAPLELCFIMEALEYQEDYARIYHKYHSLIPFPDHCVTACICSFVEEAYAKTFAADTGRLLAARGTPLLFPILYVKNSAILVFTASTLAYQDEIKELFCRLQYTGQSVTFETRFLRAAGTEELFRIILTKISRYERILLMSSQSGPCEIRNNITSAWRIGRILKELSSASGNHQVTQILNSIFTAELPLDEVRNMALCLYLKLCSNQENQNQPLEIACDFFGRLYSCTDTADIRELMQIVLCRKDSSDTNTKTGSNITLLKTYVEQHLNAENLSLKWLAEHYLFISAGYLNKMFVKEEGIRFSDYLNRKRMEEAKRLMVYYHNDNIKNIAQQVGFGNNPQYFSQVFKKYTGMSPSEFMEELG